MPSFTELMRDAGQSIGARRIFGEPYEKNGVTVIPAARIMGGIGGVEGETKPSVDGGDSDARQAALVAATAWQAGLRAPTSSRATQSPGCPPSMSTG